jgi:ABC-type uncharacterized transport system fused permease/ATPase subunit
MLKQRKWLTQDEIKTDISPKEYYQKAFKEILHEIKKNEKQIQEIIKLKKN